MRDLVARGDLRRAAEVAIRRFEPEVHRYLWAALRDEADADEAFSHWEEKVWRGLPSFRGECSLRTWSLRLATNAAINVRNAAWNRRVRRFRTGEASALANQRRSTSLRRVEQEARGFEALRGSLPLRDQLLLQLRLDNGLSWEEIAEVLSAADRPLVAGSVCKRFERLKDRLARMAHEQGLDE